MQNKIDTSKLNPERTYIFACDEKGNQITNVAFLKKYKNRRNILAKSIEKLIQELQTKKMFNRNIIIEILEKDNKLSHTYFLPQPPKTKNN